MTSVKMWPEYGATSDGLSTMVQPVASAGHDLAGDLVDRPVPRRDQAADADRLLDDERGAVLFLELEVLQHRRWPVSEVAHADARPGPAAASDWPARPSPRSSRRRGRRSASGIRPGCACSRSSALLSRLLRPGRERLPRGLDRLVDVGGRADRDLAGHLLGGRVVDVQRLGRQPDRPTGRRCRTSDIRASAFPPLTACLLHTTF